MKELEELLDSENFDPSSERISVVIDQGREKSDRPSLFKSLGKKHPRLAVALSLALAAAVWMKVLIELFK